MATSIAPQDWLRTAVAATAEVATGTLGYAESDEIEYSDTIPSNNRGAFVGLLSQHNNVQVGVTAGNGGCEKLARDLLGYEPDEHMTDEDVADAVGEIVNILAGMIKQRLEEHDDGLCLGLPMFIEGKIEPLEQQGARVAQMQLDGIGANIIIVYEGHR